MPLTDQHVAHLRALRLSGAPRLTPRPVALRAAEPALRPDEQIATFDAWLRHGHRRRVMRADEWRDALGE